MRKILFNDIIRLMLPAAFAVGGFAVSYGQQLTTSSDSYRFDIGGGLGMSGYLGDANESNIFKHPGFDAYASFRYLFDSRWALRTILSTSSLSGNTAEMTNVLPDNKSYTFTSQIYDLGVRGEYNFFGYGIGETYKRLRRWTPFLGLGFGVTLASADGTYVALSMPMSFGVKYKLKPRINLEACFTMTKVFGDHIDGPDLSDLTTIKSSFIKNNDWHSALTVGISFEFGPRCVVCNRID